MSGCPSVRQQRAVAQPHQRVDDRLGMDDDLDPVVRDPNRKCASITSRPLFISVAESTVIFAPIVPGRVGERVGAVTSRRSSAVRPRNGPPDAVSTSDRSPRRASPADALQERGVLGVHRHQPRAPLGGAASTSGPPATSDSLLASATSAPVRARPAWRRGPRRRRPRSARRPRRTPRRGGRPRRGRPRRRRLPAPRRAARPRRGGHRRSDLRRAPRPAAPGSVGADGQRLGADRPGGAEDRDPLHQVERYPGAGG